MNGAALIRISDDDPTPPYEQIKQQVARTIRNGTLTEHDRLPAVRQLAKDLGIAPGTVARAYKALEADGLVTTRRGAGTRPAPGAVARPLAAGDALGDAAARVVEAAREQRLELGDALSAVREAWQTAQPPPN